MFYKLRRTLNSRLFDWQIRSISGTSAARPTPDSPVQTVTQIHPPDVHMYLVAIKTFMQHVPVSGCWIVGDRLRPQDKALLERHVRGVRIIDIESIDTTGFPSGGTWERLLHIVHLCQDAYVIQLDADTITMSRPDEVLDCIAAGKSFTLGTSMGRSVITAAEIKQQLRGEAVADMHVQVAAELAMETALSPDSRYIRGNSAFTGFAPRSVTIDALAKFSQAMGKALGETKWAEWGSEQVSSSYCIANAPSPYVLPFERYRYFEPSSDLSGAAFLHFIGTYRFSGGTYGRMAQQAIAQMPRTS